MKSRNVLCICQAQPKSAYYAWWWVLQTACPTPHCKTQEVEGKPTESNFSSDIFGEDKVEEEIFVLEFSMMENFDLEAILDATVFVNYE